MISLLAAVPQETNLIRASLENATEETACGLTFFSGQISGVDVCLTHSGIGKAAAAAATATLTTHCQAEALWLFGCGGAYQGSGLNIGELVMASKEVFGDEGVETCSGFSSLEEMGLPMRAGEQPIFNDWPTDQALCKWASERIPDLQHGTFVTVSTCTGTMAKGLEIEKRTGGVCENMEGAAVALACHQLSVPLLELRGISNMVEDRDTSRWDLPKGMKVAQQAVLDLLKAWAKR